MAHVNGKYSFVKSENFAEYLQAIGLPKDVAEKLAANQPDVGFEVDGNKVIVHRNQDKEYILGQEVDDEIPYIGAAKCTGSLNGNVFKIVIKVPDQPERTTTRTHTFSADGVVVTFETTSNNQPLPKGTLYYKRV